MMRIDINQAYGQHKKPASLLRGRLFMGLLFASTFGVWTPVQAQSELFESLSKDFELNAELYFYTSTLRMININRDPNFDEIVQDIDKMIFYQFNDVPKGYLRTLSEKFKSDEGFEELMSVDGKEKTFYVLRKNESEFVALLKTDQDIIAVDLLGMIRVDKIPDLINSINADNFLNVFEIGKDERREHQND